MENDAMNMTASDKLLIDLGIDFPALEFCLVEKGQTAFADDEDAPDQLIAVNVNDMSIVAPYESECGRFTVDSQVEYGIPKLAAIRINTHNQRVQACQDSPTFETLSEQWDAAPAKGGHCGAIKAISDTEVIQHVGQGRHVAWHRTGLTGVAFNLDDVVQIDEDGHVQAPRDQSNDLSK